jgi:hypothetical protein
MRPLRVVADAVLAVAARLGSAVARVANADVPSNCARKRRRDVSLDTVMETLE